MIDHQTAVISETTAANNEIVAAVTGKSIEVLGYAIVNCAATAQTVIWKSATTSLTGTLSLPSSIGGGIVCPLAPKDRVWLRTSIGEALNITSSAATEIGGHVSYRYV